MATVNQQAGTNVKGETNWKKHLSNTVEWIASQDGDAVPGLTWDEHSLSYRIH
jgi:hypothetical protein